MTERGILFSAPMVRALLDGTKTQTRRAVKMPGSWDCIVYADWGNGFWPYRSDDGESPSYDNNEIPLRCPYGQPGDRLWVRETWYCDHWDVQEGPYQEVAGARELLVYRADGERPYEAEQPVWRPSIHMPRWASRILLEIVSVRVERLQDITPNDAVEEGIERVRCPDDRLCYWRDYVTGGSIAGQVGSYRSLWESINGAGSWDVNPFVWVVEFKRVTP